MHEQPLRRPRCVSICKRPSETYVPANLSSISTVTENATSINTITRVEIASSTTTVNAGATSAVANGLSYKRYTHSFNADLANPGFTASFFKNNIAVLSTGRVNTLTFSGSGGNLQLSDGSPAFEIKQAAIVFKGGFKASQTGTYTFTTTVAKNDNWGWFWIGDVAVNDWNDNNAAYKATRVGSGGFFGGTTSITLRAGEVIPITFLWANGGGAGSTDFTIRLPDGTTTTNGSGYFVESCPST